MPWYLIIGFGLPLLIAAGLVIALVAVNHFLKA